MFAIKKGIVQTPPLSTSILSALARDAIIRHATALGYTVREDPVIWSDVYLADAVFVTGTAAEAASGWLA